MLLKGSVFFREVVDVPIRIEMQIARVAVTVEEVDDPLLLFGGEHPLAVMEAVVGCLSTQVSPDAVAQRGAVFLLHLGEEGGKPTGSMMMRASLYILQVLPCRAVG